MKLISHTLLYLSGSLILVLSIWAVLFYMNMMDEVYDSIDDGLENYKILIIQKASEDSTILSLKSFDERNYAIKEVQKEYAVVAPQVFADTSMYMQAELDFEMVRMLTTFFTLDNERYYQLQILSSMVEEDDLMEDLVTALLWLFIAVIASAFLIDRYLLRKIWSPFYVLQERLNAFNLGDQKPFEAPKTQVSEFQQLNNTVAGLLSDHAKVYKSQKELIENASHELQTPLAVAITQLELLLEESMNSESLSGKLDAIMSQLQRIKRLNKSLLLLSKIENKQYEGVQEVDMILLLNDQLDQLEQLAEHQKIELIKIGFDQTVHWKLHSDLALMLVGNLLKNAILHNITNGIIRITISPTSIEIANTGSLSPLDTTTLFKRFASGSSKSHHSTGLGLSIVDAIVKHHHLQIQYAFEEQMHVFKIIR